MNPKILIIGLDAATMDLIGPWAEAGHLPALAGLMSEGASSRLISTPNMHSASAWTSILTGLNPGRHGLFVFSDRDFTTGRQVFFKGGDREGETIASHLSSQGLSSGLLNVPMTYPARCGAGCYMVSGLDAPALNEKAFCPPELRAELMARLPSYSFTPQGLGDLMSAGRIDDAIRAWIDLTETQTLAAEYLMGARPVDFFMTVFTASDWGGHNLWKYHDSAHPEHDESEAARLGGSLLAIYRKLDESVARLLNHAGEQTQVYVISDHGMGPHSGASYHLARWLEDRGYMARRGRRPARANLVSAGRRAAKDLLPVAIKERLKSAVGAERVKRLQSAEKDSFYSSIDWARTACYSEPGRHVINVNLAGRNPGGTVAPADYEKTCDRVIEDLAGWKDGQGRPVVARVVKRDEVYKGPHAGRASDLYVYWNPEARLGQLPCEVRERGFWWSGDHRLEGVLIAKGRGIRKGALSVSPAVYDLVPTVMHLAGLTVPGGLDGRVIEEICDEEFLAANPVRVAARAGGQAGERADLNQSDEQLIEEKLRSLGYL
jgi:predicted AlkP superfamily phosphohydrolase/phosphomutase